MRAAVLAFVALALFGCGDGAFSCIEDVDCGSAGRCEATGWCSFPDERCGSGRRYGMHSGDGMAGVCVDGIDEDASAESSTGSTGGAPESTVTASSGFDASSTSGAEPAGETSGSSTTDDCVGADCDSATTYVDPPEDDETSTGDSGEVDVPCPGWSDDFEDGVFDPGWSLDGVAGEAHVMQEVDGELRWELGAGYTGLLGLRRSLDPMSAVRIELGGSPSTPSAEAQMVMLLREGDLDPGLYLFWFNGQLQVRLHEETIATAPDAAWTEVRFVDDLMTVAVSDDGVTYEDVVAQEAPFETSALTLWLYGQTWTDAPLSSVASLSSVHVCEPEG